MIPDDFVIVKLNKNSAPCFSGTLFTLYLLILDYAVNNAVLFSLFSR